MEHTYTVALAGNPNVGKSTVFNRLTGLRQHTGNWPGKTVERAEGYFSQAGQRFRLVDLPGTYSLAADSPEEEVAGAFLQSGQADAVIVVVDASCLRRGLILALQLRQQTQRLVLCVNLMDEAARRGITPQTERLGQLLDVPVVATAARSGKGLAELRRQAAAMCRREPWEDGWKLTYAPPVEAALGLLETGMSRRRAVALLWGSPPTEGEQSLWQRAQQRLGALSGQALRDSLTASVVALAEEIGRQCVRCTGPDPHAPDRRLDRLLTSRLTGFPVMLLLLGLVFSLMIPWLLPRMHERYFYFAELLSLVYGAMYPKKIAVPAILMTGGFLVYSQYLFGGAPILSLRLVAAIYGVLLLYLLWQLMMSLKTKTQMGGNEYGISME